MKGDPKLYKVLEELDIEYKYLEHPPTPTIEDAIKYWHNADAAFCKNIFFRNHKGNRHYLVILDANRQLVIRDLEQRLKQGKLSFASDQRLEKYMGLKGGSVSIFGLINDSEKHVHLFIDEKLKEADSVCFHPNINEATLIISVADMIRFLNWSGNTYDFLQLY